MLQIKWGKNMCRLRKYFYRGMEYPIANKDQDTPVTNINDSQGENTTWWWQQESVLIEHEF